MGWLVGRKWKNNSECTPNCLNYCEIFVLYTQFTNVIAGRIIQPGGPHLGAHGVTNSTNSKTATATAVTATAGLCTVHDHPL